MNKITLHKHITDGGAVYWTDNDAFQLAKVIIRTDGGEIEVIRFEVKE